MLVESASNPLWLLGTAFEHHTIVNYHFRSASNVLAIGESIKAVGLESKVTSKWFTLALFLSPCMRARPWTSHPN
jgi:hypothetical protein